MVKNRFVKFGGIEKTSIIQENKHKEFEAIYKKALGARIPWKMDSFPYEQKIAEELVEGSKIIEFGCGTGDMLLKLALDGFECVGIDFCSEAIDEAKKKDKKNLCKFIIADVLNPLSFRDYDFAFNWGLIQHIHPKMLIKYIRNVYKSLRVGGRYLSVCFNEKQSTSKFLYAERINTTMYFPSDEELVNQFSKYFVIEDVKDIYVVYNNYTGQKYSMTKCLMRKANDFIS